MVQERSVRDFLGDILEAWAVCCLRRGKKKELLQGKATVVLNALAKRADDITNSRGFSPQLQAGYSPRDKFLWVTQEFLRQAGVNETAVDTFYSTGTFWKDTAWFAKAEWNGLQARRYSLEVPQDFIDSAKENNVVVPAVQQSIRRYVVAALWRTKFLETTHSTLWLGLRRNGEDEDWQSLLVNPRVTAKDRRECLLQGIKTWREQQQFNVVQTKAAGAQGDEQTGITQPQTSSEVARIEVLTRDQFSASYGGVRGCIEDAQKHVYFLSADFKEVLSNRSIDRALKRSVTVHLLGPALDSAAIDALVRLGRFSDREEAEDAIAREAKLRNLRARYPKRLLVRRYTTIPAVSLFMIDPQHPHGMVRVKPMLYMTGRLGKRGRLHRPNIIIPAKTPYWPGYFLHQWKRYWDDAQDAEK